MVIILEFISDNSNIYDLYQLSFLIQVEVFLCIVSSFCLYKDI